MYLVAFYLTTVCLFFVFFACQFLFLCPTSSVVSFSTPHFIWGTNAACSVRLLKPCWHLRDKNSWVQLCPPSLFLFFFPLPVSPFPQTPPSHHRLCLLAPFPRRVTTQQPALGAPDWWMACDGGGPSVGLVRALPVVSQHSAVREHPVCSGVTSRICLYLRYLTLQRLSKHQHSGDFLWLSVSTSGL